IRRTPAQGLRQGRRRQRAWPQRLRRRRGAHRLARHRPRGGGFAGRVVPRRDTHAAALRRRARQPWRTPMSTLHDPLQLPLDGIRAVEANAGTGKTFTIAALYLRLILERGLQPEEIVVATF